MDTQKWKDGLNKTQADLFVMLAEQLQGAYNEAHSSEPMEDVMDNYSDDMWDVWHTLDEPIEVDFNVNHKGRTVHLKFLIEAFDAEGL